MIYITQTYAGVFVYSIC